MMGSWGRSSPWARTRAAAAVAVVLVAVAAVAAPAGSAPSSAQGGGTPPATGAAVPATQGEGSQAQAPANRAHHAGNRAQDTSSQPQGTAKASAVVTRLVPGVGALELAVEQSVAVAEVTNTVAQSQAQAIDLGLIGTSLTASSCRDATIRPEDLPQPVRVDNRGGDTSERRDEVPAGPGSVGQMLAEATRRPSSRAVATNSALDIDGLVTVSGGRADARTEIEPGSHREARAVSEVDLDLAGVVRLQGLRWTALHRTGAGPVAEGTFELGAADAGGIPLPLEDLEPLQATLNEALAPSGIRIELPRVVRLTEPTDLVRVTPLRIVIQDTPLGATLLGPVLDASRDQRGDLFDAMVEAVCDAAGVLLAGDVVVSIASGTGFLALEVGGVEATTGDMVITNPFGDVPPMPLPPVEPPADPPTTEPPPATAPEPAPEAAPAEAPPTTTADTDPEQQAWPIVTAPVSAVERLCESVHPLGWPSCSTGAPVLLGLLGLAATAGMAALDWRHQRRRPAPAPTLEATP